MALLGYPKIIPYTKFDNFGIIHFWVMLSTNRQTADRPTNRRPRTSYPRQPTAIISADLVITGTLVMQ